MNKTKEVCVYIAPMIAIGLLIAWAIGVLPSGCLPRASQLAAAELGALLIASAAADLTRSTRGRSHSLVFRH